MALTWKDITGWTPGPLDTAEANLRTARSTLTELADELATMGTPSNWTGSAATAANGKLKTVSQDLKDLVAEVFGDENVLLDEPGEHQVSLYDKDGAELSVGTGVNTVATIYSGCHLK